MDKQILKNIIRDFQKSPLPELYKRDLNLPTKTNEIVSVIGARRAGKTWILFSTIKQLLKEKTEAERIVYLNFEDERLSNFQPEDFDLILQAYQELYPTIDLRKAYFFFDEVQNAPLWEKFIRRLHDSISRKIYITGSNSKLLSREIATSLRGRTIVFEVFPLSFNEFLTFNQISPDLYHSSTKAKMNVLFLDFLKLGSFPAVALEKNPDIKIKILQEYFNVMIYQDLIQRYNIKNTPLIDYFMKQLTASHAKEFSVHKIYNGARSLGLKTRITPLYEYLNYAEVIYLNGILNKFSYSLRARAQAGKKIYCVDNGLFNALTFQSEIPWGKLLEAAVFWHFKRTGKEIYYFKDKAGVECDFILSPNGKPQQAIQVCWDLRDEETKKREVRGLLSCCRFLGLKKSLIITHEEEYELEEKGVQISVLPAVKFLLS